MFFLTDAPLLFLNLLLYQKYTPEIHADSSIAMLATSAISIGYSLKALKDNL
jgi:hypothetical protein